MIKHLRLATWTFLFIGPQTLWAWGPVGHRTVGSVADRYLTASTRQILSKHLNGESLADVSTWADQIKDKPAVWDRTFPYHFESVSDNQTYLQSLDGRPQQEQSKGGLVAAMLEAKRIFKNPASKPEQRSVALKFLVHFVGDMHQPMHSGRPEDRGGNLIQRKWRKHSTNLHAIWDMMILEEAHAPKNRGASGKIDNEAFADQLVQKFQSQQPPGYYDDINMWLEESMIYREAAYQYKDESEEAYTARFAEIVDERIYYAGVRLAAMLTSLTKNEASTQLEIGFRAAVEHILGPLSELISFNPKGAGNAKNSRDIE